MTQDFFDQNTGRNDESNISATDVPDGAIILVNGSYKKLEEGGNFLQQVKNVAALAGFGKFKVWLNGIEIRPSTAPTEVRHDHKVEIKPFDEAG
mgnify:CR=1 FL=1